MLLQHVAKIHERETRTYPVRLHGKGSITIPSKHKLCVFGNVRAESANPHVPFIVEPPEFPTLPNGLFLDCALVNINSKASNKIPIILRNTTDRSITLPLKTIVGVVSAAQDVTPLNSSQCVLNYVC